MAPSILSSRNGSHLKPFVLQQTINSAGMWPLFPIYVGSNPKPFSLSLDTGSSITWLYSSLVPTAVLQGRNTYDPTDDVQSCIQENLSMKYGDGLVVRLDRMYLDELHFGENSQGGQRIFRVKSIVGQNDISENILMEGIFALKPRYDAVSAFPTIWAKLAADLPEPLFIANLRFNDTGKYIFGTTPYEGKDVRFWDCDAQEKDVWRLPITSYAVGAFTTSTRERSKNGKFQAMVDTGASSLYLPPYIVQDYYAKVPGHIQRDGLHFVPAGQVLPDLILYIGEDRYPVRISGEYLQPQGTLKDELFSLGRLEESIDPHGPVLGHPFFFAQNVIFKGVDSLSVGLVPKDARECA